MLHIRTEKLAVFAIITSTVRPPMPITAAGGFRSPPGADARRLGSARTFEGEGGEVAAKAQAELPHARHRRLQGERQLDRTAPVDSLFYNLMNWTEKNRMRWAHDYYEAAPIAKKKP